MSNQNHNNNNNNKKEVEQQYATTTGGVNNPKHIHIAHRRSPSELTNLMIEQLSLQRQLEMVQAQQQQLLAQQQQLNAAAAMTNNNSHGTVPFLPPPPPQPYNLSPNRNTNNTITNNNNSNGGSNSRSHSRNNSGYEFNRHTRGNDSVSSISSGGGGGGHGHSRRHSLGLNEAKKAAAEEQAKRAANATGNTDVTIIVDKAVSKEEQFGFKFPPGPPPASQSSVSSSSSTVSSSNTHNHNNGNNNSTFSHRRTNSSNSSTYSASPGKNYHFPPRTHYNNSHSVDFTALNNNNNNYYYYDNNNNAGENMNDFTSPRKSHSRTNSGINSNWRQQQPQQQQQQGGGGNNYLAFNTGNYNNSSSSGTNHANNSIQPNMQFSPFHKKSLSRDGATLLEPTPPFQPGHKSNLSSSSNNTNNNNNNGNGRKSLFVPYLPQASIPQLLQEGKLVVGTLRVNKKNRSDAWVSTDGVLDADVFICGSKDRNRALEGDLVAVELLCVDDVWESKKEKEEKKRRKDAGQVQQDLLNSGEDYHNDATFSPRKDSSSSHIHGRINSSTSNYDSDSQTTGNNNGNNSGLKRRGSLKQRPTQKKNDDVEVEGQSLLLVEEEEISNEFKPLYAGHIVAVLDRIPGQLFSGTLGLLRPSQQQQHNNNNHEHRKPKIVWFKPTDKKVPLVAIPTEQAPKDFVDNAEKYANKLFVAGIKRWPITSLHPFGTLVTQLGEINDPETEVEAILKDNNFLCDEYLDPVNRAVEKSTFRATPLSEESIAKRPIFDSEENGGIAIIKQNPFTASDLALNLQTSTDGKTGDSVLQLGVHIVDVTEQIESGSSLDRRARKRSTGVSIPQKNVALLPIKVNEELGLEVGKKSATISVVYSINVETMEVIDTVVKESFVVPSQLVNVEDLDVGCTEFTQQLRSIAGIFMKCRLNMDSLTPRLPLLEGLDDESVKPTLNIFNSDGYVLRELQYKANNTVAEIIYTKLGPLSFLRRQSHPLSTKLQSFFQRISNFENVEIDPTTPETCLKSMLAIKDTGVRCGVEILFFKTLQRAKYFVAGKVDPDQFDHYSLNYPLYTHFTAPFRRYSDHVVHRQLKAVINNIPYEEDIDSLKITAEYCNFKKDCSCHAQEQAIHLLLCKAINDMGNSTDQLITLGLVSQVYESSFDVFIPEFGIEKRVHGDQLPVTKAEFDSVNKILELYWQPNVDSATFIPADEKKPSSYRNSIRNKFKSTSVEIAYNELKSKPMLSEELLKKFSSMKLSPPNFTPLNNSRTPESSPLEQYLKYTTTRIEGGESYIQEIRELKQVPILLRAEIGMALPCLSVRALNPFLQSYNKAGSNS
ncbi:mRNA-binding translational repressor SSD1 SCDLUD_004601 [Saccharomycodes ludwigii]|uniref:mRNA-binding translational repressor SSD1 n=1 Tax=Saccharomycodes ludwigii TaxID=36035 RepID=UPI001E86512F|nr:hypothetical protein SCDLUD_004601 [Saccharomycodes ludwigii]KAH3899172.1 hypothetical protein SCDLUD_004601 [Saccharomycodes ludwigii]